MELGEVKNIQKKISEIPRLKQLIFKQKYLCIFWDLSGKLRKIQMHVNPHPKFSRFRVAHLRGKIRIFCLI